ncbi:xaa-Pro aminopeptidase ApepP-like [Anoplophora glabripennis]|uniref:xaa-Pro aminopeptidase ApepP-like n=1 Tax=Anoplophora glabripennis TaxID=217634 RepID=UPI000873D6F3|nr:xaa-Pro aminopeptidase ApepP-like [Anoplophora glabripennis]
MIAYKVTLICCCISLVLSSTEQEKKQNGTLRKACFELGHARQPERRVNTTLRLAKLREVLRSSITLKELPIDAYIVTSTDEHQNTEIEPFEKRRQYISGFSGSYGDAVVTQKQAALWTDGRYHLQADEQLDCNWLFFREGHRNIPKMSQWLKKNIPKNGRIGLNPKLVSEHIWSKLESELQSSSLYLVELKVDPIDKIWPPNEREPRQTKSSFVVGIQYTGKNYTTKINETRREIKRLGADAMVITALDEIAWLLNVRGRDVPFSPFIRCYVILDMHNIFMYVDISKLSKETIEYLRAGTNILGKDSVTLLEYEAFWNDSRTRYQLYHKILVPSHCVYSDGASHEVYKHISREKRLPRQSPIIHLKAVKNSVEINAMREANILDATAVCDCLAYIENKVADDREFSLHEKNLVQYLDEYRYEQYKSFGNSFRTVAAFGPNAAYPEYEPTPNTNVNIFRNSTVVLDSGGQYFGGTTVVTRTVHFGEPTDDMKEAYTRVLMGLIQLSSLTFPNKTKMAAVDALTRASLWDIGLDYEQETGHGIGAFLGTHESPIKIHYDSEISMHQVFKPGYFLTSGPGYYNAGEFGIRLENILEVYEKRWLERTGHKFLGFKTITLVPFEMKLIKLSLLSTQQRKWLNEYNKQIRELVGAKLKSQNRMDGFYWMMDRTKYVPEHAHTITTQPLLLIISSTVLILKTYFL